MSPTAIWKKRNDTAAPFRAQCLDGERVDEASPVDLTGATSARLIMRKPDTTVLSAAVTIEPGTEGRVFYDWGPSDLALVGEHAVEVEVTWANAKIQTFPARGHCVITVGHDLG